MLMREPKLRRISHLFSVQIHKEICSGSVYREQSFAIIFERPIDRTRVPHDDLATSVWPYKVRI